MPLRPPPSNPNPENIQNVAPALLPQNYPKKAQLKMNLAYDRLF